MKRTLRTLFLILTVLFLPWQVSAATYTGANLGGANLTLANGDVVSGVFTNVGTFTIPAGATVTVAQGIAFEMHATTINIAGTLDARGAGFLGGAGGTYADANQNHPGGAGQGPGAGGGGNIVGCSVHPAGGGGAGYGGAGGIGGGGNPSVRGTAGGAYGTPSGGDRAFGSGGGGGGGDCPDYAYNGGAGGAGGGSVVLDAPTVSVGGSLLADGAVGTNGDGGSYGAAGGGGGSGGTILVTATTLTVGGTLSAKGGNGGFPDGGTTTNVYAGGGGGGAGGRVKLLVTNAGVYTANITGGNGAPNGSFSQPNNSGNGAPGSFFSGVATITSLQSLTNPSVIGQSVTFSAHVTGNATGTVTFLANGASIGNGTLNGAGDATLAYAGLPIGTSSIAAVYGGDGT
ncbi:MAG: hypothetical protein JWP87_6041, partial [Labilithrix sp.]|nr:hypothetical protein [Labilithrix sp.]